MLNMLVLPDILQGKEKVSFIKALHDATEGNPEALSLLLSAVQSWSYITPADIAQFRTIWEAAKLRPPKPNALVLLRRVCKRQGFMPPSMIEALFDDASFDFAAYLRWHNSAR
ncbi:hypothetical protein J6524_11255 [Bradyrhizobium sp. WSM 1738]|uniref:hypothetical protein n=1 Tax=Bradyrhizobium hereditatis TaxID=2821405 RepID=UPI001CE2888D|nr:hypothetical protein [Bradyrhizobium hereditatis]MCA6115469.1 hypothetical protein [Bradyrhizobium hereditatis]